MPRSSLIVAVLCALAVGFAPPHVQAQAGGPRHAFSRIGIVPSMSAKVAPDAVALPVSPSVAPAAGERRSRSRGAARGFVVGAFVGLIAGALVTNDFLDDPAVNMMAGAAVGGLAGALVGAAIGVREPERNASLSQPRGNVRAKSERGGFDG